MMNKGWIGVDLDGTLAHYENWIAIDHIGAPIAPMVIRVQRWIAEGREVRIFTARCDPSGHGNAGMAIWYIRQWCIQHIGHDLPVTNVKDMHMIELWDDRAVQVIPNMGEPVGRSTRGLA